MTDTTNLDIGVDVVSAGVQPNSSALVTNVSGGTLYYGATPEVSPTNNLGSLTTGQSATFILPTWLVASATTSVSIATTQDQTVSLGSVTAATTPGSVVKKLTVYDAAGNTVGYLAVYGAIS